MPNYISIGKILNFHGLKGEVKVGYNTSKPEQLESLKTVLIDKETFHIQSVRFHKNVAIIKFKEINSINEVEKIKGKFLVIEKSVIENALEEDEYFVTDLEGLDAYDVDGKYLGAIVSVGENKSASLLGIKDSNEKIHLVPFVKNLVPIVDIPNNRVVINNIEGLIE